MFKIHKSNLNELINEAHGPYYISNVQERRVNKEGMLLCSHKVYVAGFNEFDQACELLLATQNIWVEEKEACIAARKQADEWEQEVRVRLKALDIEVRDGRLSEEPVLGSLD